MESTSVPSTSNRTAVAMVLSFQSTVDSGGGWFDPLTAEGADLGDEHREPTFRDQRPRPGDNPPEDDRDGDRGGMRPE
ncbi:MAG TPA: hypothetical protein VGL47_34635 [Amycolatopsis sp.]|uniref:hypothetical protein n=1 Tax=Amycolatopsis sp. TaxID=37632 RepID=UPI002F401433